MPWHHGTHFLEHFLGITRSFLTDFSFGQLVEMYKPILIRARILASGQYSTKEKDSNDGYNFDLVDSGLTKEEISALKGIPSRRDIDRACETAWTEASAFASQFARMQIPTLPLDSSQIHPQFWEEELSENEEIPEETTLPKLDPKTLDSESDTLRIPRSKESRRSGSSLSPAEALAHASHHILTEKYFAEEAEKSKAELAQIHKQLGYPISRTALSSQRAKHCAGTHVHSKPLVNYTRSRS
ncbi:hypothetical protein C8R43DRAFT_1142705 [Mycena crocata]|nr:hypothetical protein C8R43DRAFT_1142705 [Mycena crocata]